MLKSRMQFFRLQAKVLESHYFSNSF